jgi:hypothetical protein
LRFCLFQSGLGKCERELLVGPRRLEKKIAFLHKLAGREVYLKQEPIEAGSHFRFARGSHGSFVFKDLRRGRLLGRHRLGHQASRSED